MGAQTKRTGAGIEVVQHGEGGRRQPVFKGLQAQAIALRFGGIPCTGGLPRTSYPIDKRYGAAPLSVLCEFKECPSRAEAARRGQTRGNLPAWLKWPKRLSPLQHTTHEKPVAHMDRAIFSDFLCAKDQFGRVELNNGSGATLHVQPGGYHAAEVEALSRRGHPSEQGGHPAAVRNTELSLCSGVRRAGHIDRLIELLQNRGTPCKAKVPVRQRPGRHRTRRHSRWPPTEGEIISNSAHCLPLADQ
jgi:hypothetical protein